MATIDMRTAKVTFAPGVRLGAYELLMEIGRGGVATAIVARKVGALGFERFVVIKRVHRQLLANKEFATMFRDEARLAASIRHTNVASVIDVVEAGTELCLVMEYFEALSLSGLLVTAGDKWRPSLRVVSRIVSDTLAGLEAVHEATDVYGHALDIVHRDLSPQNIIVDTGGTSRVIDFGIAKAVGRLTNTKVGIVKGKLGYMAPEQIEALPLDRRTDVFATGVVLHELVTGRRLFGGEKEDDFATIRRILRGSYPAPGTVVPDVPPGLDAVVSRALARAPKDRYANAADFQAALEQAVPPASPREVGVWVQMVAGAKLGERRKELLGTMQPGVADSREGVVLSDETPAPPLEFVNTDSIEVRLSDVGGEAAVPAPVRPARARWVTLLLAVLLVAVVALVLRR
jgi:serine/threonine-protein kinase